MSDTIWVVDDNAAVAESVVAVLLTESLAAESIPGPEQAIRRLQTGEVPLAMILDLAMPPGDGNHVLQELLAHPDLTFPVVVITGDPSHLHKAVCGRVFKVLTKPVDPLEMVGHLRRSLGLGSAVG